MNRARSLDRLLSSGQVRWGSSTKTLRAPQLEAPREPQWRLDALGGRVVEMVGSGGAALLTEATALVREAQVDCEPVAWLTQPHATFFPPDLAAAGVDLDALSVVRLVALEALLRAADRLLRSGAFGLVVLDLVSAECERLDVPLSVQVRLANLAKASDATLLCLVRGEALWSTASLRAASTRQRTGEGRFTSVLEVCKDKRHGKVWRRAQDYRGPLGLR